MKNQILKHFRLVRIGTVILSSILLIVLNSNAQETVATSGGDASTSGGSVNYTIGQIVYTTTVSTNGSVAAGVQQPYEISVPTALENTEDIILEFSAYPNPTTDILKLSTGKRDTKNISYRLFDMNGKLIKAGNLTGPETSVNMKNLSHSVYLIKVIENNKEIKTFKIIKK